MEWIVILAMIIFVGGMLGVVWEAARYQKEYQKEYHHEIREKQ